MNFAFMSRPVDPSLAPLFAACFSLSESEAESLLATVAPDATALVACGEEIVSEGILIPVQYGVHLGLYLYGLCTAPAYRGRGYLRDLLAAAKKWATENGYDFLTLIPADADLRAYYRRAGFSEEIALHADARGENFLLRLPPTDTHPFDGDYAALYLMTDRSLPYSAFCLSLISVEETGEIVYTEGGWRMQSRSEPTLCFACDQKTLKAAELVPCEESALLCPLHRLSALPKTADPLPR